MKNKIASICLLIPTIVILLIFPQTVSANSSGSIQVTGPNISQVITYDQMYLLPTTSVYAELYCYGNFVTSGVWEGVKLSDVLNYVGLSITEGSIDFVAQDGYKVSIPVDAALKPDVIIAYRKDDTPLTEVYRLVLPGVNGNLWISTITSLSPGSGSPAMSISPAGPALVNIQNEFLAPHPQPTALPTPATTDSTPKVTPEPTNLTVQQPANPNLNGTQTPETPNGNMVSPNEAIYVAALAIPIAAVAAGLIVVRLRKHH
jgi:hypothetical protein